MSANGNNSITGHNFRRRLRDRFAVGQSAGTSLPVSRITGQPSTALPVSPRTSSPLHTSSRRPSTSSEHSQYMYLGTAPPAPGPWRPDEFRAVIVTGSTGTPFPQQQRQGVQEARTLGFMAGYERGKELGEQGMFLNETRHPPSSSSRPGSAGRLVYVPPDTQIGVYEAYRRAFEQGVMAGLREARRLMQAREASPGRRSSQSPHGRV